MSFLKTIMGVVKTAAPVAANIILPGTGSIISGLMDTVLQEKSGYDDASLSAMTTNQKAELIASNPELMAELETKALALEAKLAEQMTSNRADINETMRAELISGAWYQRAWRPWNGFLFPLTVLAVYVGVPLFLAFHPLEAMGVDISVPEWLWITWAGVLGVGSYGRNKQKQAAAGGNADGGLIKTLVSKFTK